jgi:hypothetical protein
MRPRNAGFATESAQEGTRLEPSVCPLKKDPLVETVLFDLFSTSLARGIEPFVRVFVPRLVIAQRRAEHLELALTPVG